VLRAGVARFNSDIARVALDLGRRANSLRHLLRLEVRARIRAGFDPTYDSIDSLVEFTTGILRDPEGTLEDDLGACVSPRNRAVLAVEAMKSWIDNHDDPNHPWAYPPLARREGYRITMAKPEPVYTITDLAPEPLRTTEIDQFNIPTLSTKIQGVVL
jgi:hypothetical protein